MLSLSSKLQRQVLPSSLAAVRRLATTNQEGLGERLRHKAEDLVHKAEDVVHDVEHRVEGAVHRVQDYVHEKKEHAREEAERGMFTADDIQEVAAQFAAARRGDQNIVQTAAKTEQRMAHKEPGRKRDTHPDYEEELLEEATQDFGTDARQRELKGLQDLAKKDREG